MHAHIAVGADITRDAGVTSVVTQSIVDNAKVVLIGRSITVSAAARNDDSSSPIISAASQGIIGYNKGARGLPQQGLRV